MSVPLTKNAGATSPPTGRTAPQLPRGSRTVAAVLVAVVLLAVTGVLAAQAISIYRSGSLLWWDAPAIADRLHTTSWQDPAVIAGSAVLIAIGLWLLALAVIPARHTLVELREDDPALSTGISSAGLRRGLGAAALRVDGISAADARIRRGTVCVVTRTPLARSESLPAAVTTAVTDRLGQLDPVRPLSVRATVTSTASPSISRSSSSVGDAAPGERTDESSAPIAANPGSEDGR